MSITWESKQLEFNRTSFNRRVRIYSIAAVTGLILSCVYVFAR